MKRTLWIYDEARTAHLERAAEWSGGRLLYRISRYDFDETLARRVRAKRVGRLGVALHLATHTYDSVEVNEPAAYVFWPSLALSFTVLRLRDLLMRRKTSVVAYAIENADFIENASRHLPLPTSVSRWMITRAFRIVARRFTRIAFGTSQARDAYTRADPRLLGHVDHTLIEALPERCATCQLASAKKSIAAFVGAFDDRKGVLQLLDVWPIVSPSDKPELRVLGKGPLEAAVKERSAAVGSVAVEVDPPRVRIHEVLAEAKALVLLSQPEHGWKEQVGLPIVEALSHGCEIVTTDETGLANWLRDHGHMVVSARSDPKVTADAIAAALASDRSPAELTRLLPERDGRMAANSWLHDGQHGGMHTEIAHERRDKHGG